MENLIVIRKSKGGRDIVSAKELAEFLEIETRFDKWILRMIEYGFTQDVDFQCLTKNVQMPNGGSKSVVDDYAITTSMAKEIAMIQRTDKGKIARQYFIECERKLKEVSVPQSYAQALLEAGRLALELEKEQAQNKIMKPKADHYDVIVSSDDVIDIGTAAKVLNMGLGRNKLFDFLRSQKVLMDNNQPKQYYIDNNWFKVSELPYPDHNGKTRIAIKTEVYQKGLDGIRKMILKTRV